MRSHIVKAECRASDAPKEPEFTLFDRFPPTTNDATTTARVRTAFDSFFGDRATDLPLQSASEDFSDIPTSLLVPYTYGESAELTPIPTDGPTRPDASLRISLSITRPTSPRSSSRPSTPVPRLWWSRPSHGSGELSRSSTGATPGHAGQLFALLHDGGDDLVVRAKLGIERVQQFADGGVKRTGRQWEELR
jgi:hypothetical protein